jgi:steroid delta-isomerase-like uncharacterized protein
MARLLFEFFDLHNTDMCGLTDSTVNTILDPKTHNVGGNMSALDAAQEYFDAWNRRSPEGIVATIQPGGSYEDPMTGGPLSGPAIAQYAAGLFEAFPDLAFELINPAATGPNSVAAQWVMRGTNTGPLQGAPPTGKFVTLAGADFIGTDGNKVASVKGYFDSIEVPRQLGMQVIVQPRP